MTGTWFAAFVWAGDAFSWPAVLVSMKPSLFPFGLIGIRRPSWWIAALVIALVNLPLVGLWVEYPSVVRTACLALLYSIGNVPMFIAPILGLACASSRPSGEDARLGLRRPRLNPGLEPRTPSSSS
jgi:hypothetical protein